jgi:polyisoprenoid-binding protein YceI
MYKGTLRRNEISLIGRKSIAKLCCLMTVALSIAFPKVSSAQTNYHIAENPTMDLRGTSAVHNWGMTTHAFTGKATFTISADGQLSAVGGLSLMLPVQNLKSENAGITKKAYKALKADQFENIMFELTSAHFISSGFNRYRIVAYGNLTIAGVTQPTTLNASLVIHDDGTVAFMGVTPLYLSDFNIERPSFLLGAMKVDDVVVLNYTMLFVKD